MATGKFHSHPQKTKDTGNHNLIECSHKVNGQYIHYKPARATEGKTLIKIKESDGTRELIIPDRNPIDIPKTLPKSEMKRLQDQGHVVTFEEKAQMMEETEQQKLKLLAESQERKDRLAKLAKQNKKNVKLNELQVEAKRKNLYTLQRAFEMKHEQEPEVKEATSIILAAKCKAIRDAQIAEKTLVSKELEEEERRLDMMMEQKRQYAIQEEEKKKQLEEEKRLKFITQVQNQIQENEMKRLIEAEKIEEESKQIIKANIAMQRDEAALLVKKADEQKQMRADLRRANEEMDYYKRIRSEEERIADLRIKEFLRKKQEREAAHEQEIKLQKLAKEREITRLRAQQQQSQDTEAIAQELAARRIQDEAERAWRQKELEAVKKKQVILDDLKMERAKQIEDIRRAQALEMERDKQQFLQLAKVQKQDYEKEAEKRRKRKEEALKHRKDLLKQVDVKERERIQEHKHKFEEGYALKKEREIRDKHIKATIRDKISKLRSSNIPEKYVGDVERQLKNVL